jgi:hypothetical protein
MSKKKPVVEEVPPPPVFDTAFMAKLVSADGHTFYADRNCVRISKVFKAALSKPNEEATRTDEGVVGNTLVHPNVVTVPFLSGAQLEQALRFMMLKYKYDNEAADRPQFQSTLDDAQLLSIATLLKC